MDFCWEALGTSVVASQVSSDGFEVTNLISSNAKFKQAGFIAERFIKPPIDIVFTFPCEVQLNYIHLFTSVGSQKSIGIDVTSYVKDEVDSANKNNASDILLGKCFISSECDNQVVFFNRLFVNRPPFDSLNSASVPECNISRIMKLSQIAGVNRVIKLKIRLWKTANGSLACLGKIVINAIPGRTVIKPTIDRLLTTVKGNSGKLDVVKEQKIQSIACKGSTSGISNKTTHSGDFKSTAGVPDEFLDSITFEIMSYPVVLPSGNIVDQTTLDKHITAEAAWGRLPSDLFTGLPFTKERRPIPNIALKSRIDQFLLRNIHLESELTANGRTTGKRKRYDDVLPFKSLTTITQNTNSENNASKNKNANKSEHQLELEQSLREAKKAVFEGRSAANKSLTVFASPLVCVSCKVATKADAVFYRLPCNHQVCRSCISKCDRSVKHCPACDTVYQLADIQRSY